MANFTLPPPVPQRGDRATFSSRVDAFLTWMAGLIPQLNAFLASLNSLAAGGTYSIPLNWNGQLSVGGNLGAIATAQDATSQAASTSLFIDKVNSAGVNIASILSSQFVAGNSSARKGSLRIQKVGDPSKWLTFDVMLLNDSPATYGSMVVVNTGSSSANPFINGDAVMVFAQRSGEKGENGPIQAPTLYVREERAAGSNSSTSLVSGTWVKRSLNAVKINTITGSSVTNDVISLPAGTYDYVGSSSAYSVNTHKAGLFNTTDATADYGTAESAGSATAVSNRSFVRGTFTISASKSFELRHICSTSGSGGTAAGYGTTEVYAEILFKKVA